MIEVLVGRYVLEDPIASGGMGTVHRATDERLGRTVAIKILKENLSGDPRFVERFRREARAAAALSHPNIANVYDYGEEDGRHFIVMEFVDGRDLADVIRDEGKLPPERAVAIAIQAADALGHAHAAGLIHRDVKTSNVLLADLDVVKVTDFGIARAAGDATLTATGVIMGTAHYLSPEQASGQPAGPPSDVYSMGIVLYEMLTGALPFTGDSALAVAMRHASEEVPRPGALLPGLPKPLDDIVGRATAKAPEDRFADGSEFAAALSGAHESRTAPVPGASTVPLAGSDTAVLTGTAAVAAERRPWAGRRIGWLVGALLLGLAAVALALGLYRALSDEEPQPRSRVPVVSDDDDAEVVTSPSPTDTPFYKLSTDIVGDNFKVWEERLKKLGFEVSKEDEDTDEYEKDQIVTTDPEPGSELEEGQAVTLIVSTGKAPDEDENGKPDGPPGQEKKEDDD